MAMNTGLKDDNKALMIEVDKYLKRIRQLENQHNRDEKEKQEATLLSHDTQKEKERLLE